MMMHEEEGDARVREDLETQRALGVQAASGVQSSLNLSSCDQLSGVSCSAIPSLHRGHRRM
jgi:hypothetical protein